MIIYATPFRNSDKQPTGPSTDSGFASLGQTRDAMGPDNGCTHPRILIYGDGEDRVAFSDFIFSIDGRENTA